MEEDIKFWDKKLNKEELKAILKDEYNSRFAEYAALLLSRTNRPKIVFLYLDKKTFCRNWRKIKRQMRTNKWSDNKIIFWDEVYKVVVQGIDRSELKTPREKKAIISIGWDIKEARKKKGWTQQELAQKAGLCQQSISFVENDYVNISIRTLNKITAALGLRISLEDKTSPQVKAETYTSGHTPE